MMTFEPLATQQFNSVQNAINADIFHGKERTIKISDNSRRDYYIQ